MSTEETPSLEEAAPVTEASVEGSAPPPIEAPSTDSSGAVASSGEVSAEASAPVAEMEKKEEATLPEFDFEGWGGELDTLPDIYRPMGTKLSEHWSAKIKEHATDFEDLRKLNEALLLGQEDPRLSQQQTQLTELQAKYKAQSEEYSQFKTSIEKLYEDEAQRYVRDFREKHSDVFEDEAKSAQLQELIEGDWEPDIAIKLLTLGEEGVKLAQAAKADGVPDSYAVRLAEATLAKTQVKAKVEPRAGARITSGATASTTPNQVDRGLGDARSLDDIRTIAARRALRAVSGGNRRS